MVKSRLKTPEWILEGYDSPAEYAKAKGEPTKDKRPSQIRSDSSKSQIKETKTFKIKVCPKCGSDNVGIILSNLDSEEESNTGKQWECRKCKWTGKDIKEKELTEDEFMKYLDDKGEEVA